MKWSYDKILDTCTKRSDQVRDLMREDLKFTVTGLTEVCKAHPEECMIFFSKLIGRAFNYQSETDLSAALHRGLDKPKDMADVIAFLSELKDTVENAAETKDKGDEMTEDKTTAPASDSTTPPASETTEIPVGEKETKGKVKKERVAKPVGMRDLSKGNPYRDGSVKARVFSMMTKFDGSRDEFFAALDKNWVDAGNEKPKCLRFLAQSVIRECKKHGWAVIDEVNGKLTITLSVKNV